MTSEEQIKLLTETIGVLISCMKTNDKKEELSEELLKQSMDANVLYCRFVSDHFEMSSEELSELFDNWIGQFSEEELEEITDNPVDPSDNVDGRKIGAECEPKKLWSMDDLLSELNPNEDN